MSFTAHDVAAVDRIEQLAFFIDHKIIAAVLFAQPARHHVCRRAIGRRDLNRQRPECIAQESNQLFGLRRTARIDYQHIIGKRQIGEGLLIAREGARQESDENIVAYLALFFAVNFAPLPFF